MIVTTGLGDKGLIWLAAALILLVNKRTRNIGIWVIAALVLSTFVGEGILKHLIQRPRPYDDFPNVQLLIEKSTKYSLPSGHTTSGFAAAYVLAKYSKKYSALFYGTASLIAFSRLYLFMHYPSDVVAGIILGIACGKTVEHFESGILNSGKN